MVNDRSTEGLLYVVLEEKKPVLYRKFDFFSVGSIFISPTEHQKQYFHQWRSHE